MILKNWMKNMIFNQILNSLHFPMSIYGALWKCQVYYIDKTRQGKGIHLQISSLASWAVLDNSCAISTKSKCLSGIRHVYNERFLKGFFLLSLDLLLHVVMSIIWIGAIMYSGCHIIFISLLKWFLAFSNLFNAKCGFQMKPMKKFNNED